MKKLFSTLLIILFSTLINAQDKSPLALFPAISPDGQTIAFSYQGDIWTVPANGGEAKRLTVHEAYETTPIWCPQGKAIAFQSNRFGNPDIFRIPKDGGVPFRLTYRSSADIPTSWANSGRIYFSTSRDYRQIEWESEIYSVSVMGGTPERSLNSFGDMAAESPNGNLIAFVKGSCRLTREDYRGPANRDIWIYNKKNDKYYKITEFEGNDFQPQWADDNTIYFISARQGRYNIHYFNIDNEGKLSGEIKALTNYKYDGVRYFSLSVNGKDIAFEREDKIFTIKTTGGEASQVNITINADYKFDPVVSKSFSNKISDYSVSPNGKLLSFVVHGDVFVKRADKEDSKSVNLTNHPFNDSETTWLNDSTLIFTSDRFGNYDLFMVKSADQKQPDLFKSLKHKVEKIYDAEKDITNPKVSPDGKKILWIEGNGKLVVASIDKDGDISGKKVILDGWAKPEGIRWSPDSRWLAYSISDLYFNDDIYIVPADGSKKPANISMHPRGDYSPVWSPDGSKLAFVSARNNSDNDVWFVWLSKKDWEKSKEDWKDEELYKDDSKKNKDKKKKDKNEVEPIKIDLENIWERLVQVTKLDGDETSPAFDKDGKYIYFTAKNPTSKGRDLFKVKWDGTELKSVTKGGPNPYGITLDNQNKYLYMVKSGGSIARLKLGSTKMESLPFKAIVKINYLKENEQVFEEAWRSLNEGFYDPKFHGYDWKALKEKYKPWVLKASTAQDFTYMFNVMLGQLNASHMGMYGNGREEVQSQRTGLLGVEIKPLEEGVKITRVIPETPASKEESKLNVGDVILKVDGNEVTGKVNFYSFFEDKANEKVLLTVKDKNGNEREVVIRPVRSIRTALYNEWVKDKRKLVEKYSNGKLGYLHIRGMDMPSFERFERELTAAGHGKEGIVIDVRYNGGGWTTDYLMAILNVKQHAYTIPRGAAKDLEKEHLKFRNYYAFGERLPFGVWNKPSIAMCNECSYSNAEIFSHAYKTLGIGKLVGIPTFGAVISTGGKGLLNGSYVRMPFRAWYVKATDQNMELGPAVPDIIVSNSPDSRAKGVDEQLKRAVDELLKDLK